MPTFTFKSPEGKTYTINGPEGATKEQAWDMLQTQLDGGAQAPAAAAEATPSKSFGEKLANFARNVYNNPPPSVEALKSAVTLPQRAWRGQADVTTDEGISQNMPEALGLATLGKLGLSRTAGGAGGLISPRAEKLVQDAQATAKATGTQPAFDASRFLDHPAVDAGMDFLLPAWASKAIRMGRNMLPETPEAAAPGPGPTGPTGPSVAPSTPFQPGAQQQASGVAGAPRLTFPDSPFGEPPAAPSVPNVPPPPWGFPTEPRAPVKVNTGDIEKTLLAQVRAINRADKQAGAATKQPPSGGPIEAGAPAPMPPPAPGPSSPFPGPATPAPMSMPGQEPVALPPGNGAINMPQGPQPLMPPPVLAAKAITKANGKVTTTPSERSPAAPVEPVAPVTPPVAAPSMQADAVLARMQAAQKDDLMTRAQNITHPVSYEDQLGETRGMDLREHSAALDPNVGMDPLAAANHIADNLEKGGYKYHTSRENFVEDYLAPVLESKAQAADRLSRILPGNIPADKLTHHMWALNKEQARTWRTQLMEEYAPHLASQIKAAFPDKLLTNWSSSRRR